MKRTLSLYGLLVAAAMLFWLVPNLGAEIVKREMYTDSSGNKVSQWVYQAGGSRSFRGYDSGYYWPYGGYGYGSGYRRVIVIRPPVMPKPPRPHPIPHGGGVRFGGGGFSGGHGGRGR